MKPNLNNNFKSISTTIVEEVLSPKKLSFSNAGLWNIQNKMKTASTLRSRRALSIY